MSKFSLTYFYLRPARITRLVLTMLAVGCLISFAINYPGWPHLISTARAASRPSGVKPFSAVVQVDYYSESAHLERSVLLHYFRYSDRSFIIQQAELLPASKEMVSQMVDMTGRRQTFLEPVTRSASTINYSDDHLDRFTSGLWDETCPTKDDEVTDSKSGGAFFGHQSTHIKKVWSSEWSQERWMLPEYECFTVKQADALKTSTGAIGAHNVKTALEFVDGEPARTRLSVPGDYVERSPLDTEHLYASTTGAKELWGAALSQRLEQEYRAHRSSTPAIQ